MPADTTDELDETPSKPNVPSNILGKAMERFHQTQEDGLAGLGKEESDDVPPPEEKKEVDPPVKPADKPPVDEEDEIDNINVDDIRTRTGLPISENAKEKFKKLENSRNKWKAKVSNYEKKVAEFEARLAATNTSSTDIQNAPELKALKEENAKLKETQDLLFFEQSDEWKNTFEAPINALSERINGIIGSAIKTLGSQTKSELSLALNRANALLGNPESEAEYDSIIDGITESVLTGTSGAKLALAMQEVWKLAVNRNKARADKASARDAITSKQRESREKSKQSLEELLKLQETAFEQTPVGQALSKTFAEKFNYAESKTVGTKLVTEALDIFLKTGVATPELSEALHHASLKRVHDKERDFLLAGYNTMVELADKQKKEIAALEKRITELRGGVGERTTPTSVKEAKDQKSRQQQKPFSLAQALDEKINSFSC